MQDLWSALLVPQRFPGGSATSSVELVQARVRRAACVLCISRAGCCGAACCSAGPERRSVWVIPYLGCLEHACAECTSAVVWTCV